MKPFYVRAEGISHEKQQALLDLAVDAGAELDDCRQCSRRNTSQRAAIIADWDFFGVGSHGTLFEDDVDRFGDDAVEMTHQQARDYLQGLIDCRDNHLPNHRHDTPTATNLLNQGACILDMRGAEYEQEGNQERSFDNVSAAFNAITGKEITPAEVALMLQCLKDVRQWSQDKLHRDSVIDGINYAALKGELLYKQYGDSSD